jgi:hypothetical protein
LPNLNTAGDAPALQVAKKRRKRIGPGRLKTPGPNQFNLFLLPAVVVAKIVPTIIHAAVQVMPTVFTADVMAVDESVMMVRPMAGHPNHLIFAGPVTRTMTVVWPVTEFDSNSLRLDGAPESEARHADRHEH